MSVLDSLLPIMERHGVQCDSEQFHAHVNVTFHEFESEVYDQVHRCMWQSLPRQFELLVGDWLASNPQCPREIRLLDIGCGTGLATDAILKTAIGPRIASIDLLDTSPSMLRRAAARARKWKPPVTCRECTLAEIGGAQFELIVTCSVLHHVPDLPAFLNGVAARQPAGGVFLHLQDPNGDFANDPELRRRTEEFARKAKPLLPPAVARLAPQRILGRIFRELSGQQGQDYISKTNRALLEKGVIRTPLSPADLWAVTDIHIGNGEAISIERMKSWLPDYDLLSQRSYAFYGELWSDLPARLRRAEEDLGAQKAPNGAYAGAIWQRKASSGGAPRVD